ncbi:unnamed protein product, partial [Prorocentrum cordatum]
HAAAGRPGPGRRRVGDAALHRPSGGPGPEPRRRGGRAAPDAEGSGAGPRGPRRGARRRRASQAPAAPGRRGGGEAPRGGVGRASGHQEVHRGGGGLQEDRGRLSWALHGAVQNSNDSAPRRRWPAEGLGASELDSAWGTAAAAGAARGGLRRGGWKLLVREDGQQWREEKP